MGAGARGSEHGWAREREGVSAKIDRRMTKVLKGTVSSICITST